MFGAWCLVVGGEVWRVWRNVHSGAHSLTKVRLGLGRGWLSVSVDKQMRLWGWKKRGGEEGKDGLAGVLPMAPSRQFIKTCTLWGMGDTMVRKRGKNPLVVWVVTIWKWEEEGWCGWRRGLGLRLEVAHCHQLKECIGPLFTCRTAFSKRSDEKEKDRTYNKWSLAFW